VQATDVSPRPIVWGQLASALSQGPRLLRGLGSLPPAQWRQLAGGSAAGVSPAALWRAAHPPSTPGFRQDAGPRIRRLRALDRLKLPALRQQQRPAVRTTEPMQPALL